MSSVTSAAQNQSTQASIAEVRFIFARWLQSKITAEPVAAQVFISIRIYWKPVSNCANSTTLSLSDLRNVNSLEVKRLNGGTWQAAEEVVKKTEHERKASVLVCGDVHGPLRRKHLLMVSCITHGWCCEGEVFRKMSDSMSNHRAGFYRLKLTDIITTTCN